MSTMKAFSTLSVATILLMAGAGFVMTNTAQAGGAKQIPPQPVAVNIQGESTLQGDFNGDGRLERVKFGKTGGGFISAYLVTDKGRQLWVSSDNYYKRYKSGFVADVNEDGRPELVFSNDKRTDVLRWNNGKFSSPTSYELVRTARSTTEFLCVDSAQEKRRAKKGEGWISAKAEQYIPSVDGESNSCNVKGQNRLITLGNLRLVKSSLWADVIIDKNIMGQVRLDKATLGDGRTLNALEEKTPSCYIPAVAVPYPCTNKYQADVNGDGQHETISFVGYYPRTATEQRLQIIVKDSKGKLLCSTPRVSAAVTSKNPAVRILKAGEGGIEASVLYGFAICDTDEDGKQELIFSTSRRGYDEVEIWRCANGKLDFVRRACLMRSKQSPRLYMYVDTAISRDSKALDKDKRIYRETNQSEDGMFAWTKYFTVGRLNMKHGEIWGVECPQGYSPFGDYVKLVPCTTGMMVEATVPNRDNEFFPSAKGS